MPLLGGYTALGTRVLVLGLAAMSLNFLLGLHRRAVASAMPPISASAPMARACRSNISLPSTPLALLVGMLLGGLAGALLGMLIVRRRGVYFAMVTIAFGQVFYYIAFQLELGDRRRRRLARLRARSRSISGCSTIDILHNAVAFYYFVLVLLRDRRRRSWAFILRSPFGRTLLAIRENERRARFLGIPVERHIWIVVLAVVLLHRPCRRALRAAEQFRRSARACTTASPATSSSWR